MNMLKYLRVINKTSLVVALVLAAALFSVRQVAAAPILNTADCAAPIITQPNLLTRTISLEWSKVMNATSFNLQILPLGGVCGVTAPIREIKNIKGTPSSYELPADVACGLVNICVQSNCCNDRCDSCELDPNKDYCSDMATKYTTACGCRDHGGTPGTFKYKYAGDKVVGCTWECAEGLVGGNIKTCGTDYEVQCAKPPHDTIVGTKPYYGLCAVFDSVKQLKNGDDYLATPVGSGGSLLYTWNCLGAKAPSDTGCFACREQLVQH
jgi:hypothetical protein